jgi:hypothetical protein
MEAVCSFTMPINFYHAEWHHIPEDTAIQVLNEVNDN